MQEERKESLPLLLLKLSIHLKNVRKAVFTKIHRSVVAVVQSLGCV